MEDARHRSIPAAQRPKVAPQLPHHITAGFLSVQWKTMATAYLYFSEMVTLPVGVRAFATSTRVSENMTTANPKVAAAFTDRGLGRVANYSRARRFNPRRTYYYFN